MQAIKEIFPLIVSASRATDIIGCHLDWFKQQLKNGFTLWKNPFNQQIQKVNFSNTRAFVFWTKDPVTMLKHVNFFENLNFYVHVTINNYAPEELEPYLPPLTQRINSFIELSKCFGKDRLIWRFDPIIVTDKLNIERLMDNIKDLAEKLSTYTTKLVFSLADIDEYKSVKKKLNKIGIKYKNFTIDEVYKLAQEFQNISKQFKLKIATCAENYSLEEYSIIKNRCIDPLLLLKLYSHDKVLVDYILKHKSKVSGKFQKDKGQRKFCNCFPSKDIGIYNSCKFGCYYCYANKY